MKRIFHLGLLVFFSSLSFSVIADVDANTARAKIEEAVAVYRESQSRGHAWQQTRIHLENARDALERGDYTQAVSEAERSIGMAKASLAQADAEQTAWRVRFPKVR